MSLNDVPMSQRVSIGFFGRRNAGKSSLVNAVTNQKMSLVSDVKGTTTDPVTKAMELLPLGPVVIIDTPGFDDEGELGKLRVQRTNEILLRVDAAVLTVDGTAGLCEADRQLLKLFEERKIPYIIAYNKCDIADKNKISDPGGVWVSAKNGEGINELKNKLAALTAKNAKSRRLCADLAGKNDVVVLVIPIDSAAPKGRLILPQQMAIRDLLEAGTVPVCVRETELEAALMSLKTTPKLVITDSQAFDFVSKIVPEDVPLTSFSILMARYKGFLRTAADGAAAIDSLKDGDKILVAEGCTHHRQCDDIGTVKIPRLLRKYSGKKLEFGDSSGHGFPQSAEELKEFALIIHCGGCMLNDREVLSRMELAEKSGVPFTNYGVAIAYMRGILPRVVKMLPEIAGQNGE